MELMAKDDLVQFAVGRTPFAAGMSINRSEMAALFSDDADPGGLALFADCAHVYSFFGFSHEIYRRNLTLACAGHVTFVPFKPEGTGHIAERYLAAIGASASALDPRIKPTPADYHAAMELRSRSGLGNDGYAILFPGSGSIRKNWPASNFVELAIELRSRMAVAFVLGPAEQQMRVMFERDLLTVFEDLALGTVAALAAESTGFIANDSGVAHLAAAAGAPGVVIYGPSDPDAWRVLGRAAAITTANMSAISPREVAAAFLSLVGN